jgi:hypothetical protein
MRDSTQQYVRFEGLRELLVSLELLDYANCPDCVPDTDENGGPPYDVQAYLTGLAEQVVDPIRKSQELLDGAPYLTRMFTTMSAEEMTRDPMFAFNGDLPRVSNIHTRERVVECSPSFLLSNAPWRVEFEDGLIVRGMGFTWPLTQPSDEFPANRRILAIGEEGPGEVIVDNKPTIAAEVDASNARMDRAAQETAEAYEDRRDGLCAVSDLGARTLTPVLGVLVALAMIRRRHPRRQR